MALTGNQRTYLRGLGHHLTAIVQIGQGGVSEGVIGALAVALNDHELVKVKFAQHIEDRDAAAEALATGTGAVVVQQLGRTALLYKAHPQKPKIVLPKPRKPQGAAKPSGLKKAPGAAVASAGEPTAEGDEDADDVESDEAE